MPKKVNLDQAYLYDGQFYGPGEVEVPDKLFEEDEQAKLSEDFRKALEVEKPKNGRRKS